MNIGLIPMSAKPYHLGHHLLVQFAALGVIGDEINRVEGPQNDVVYVFVSFSGRGTKTSRKGEVPIQGETPVYGSDMRYIWSSLLIPNLRLPNNVEILTPDDGIPASPIRCVFDILDSVYSAKLEGREELTLPHAKLDVDISELTIHIYSDEHDIDANYPDSYLETRYPGMLNAASSPALVKVGVKRNSTVNISGTKMRQFLCDGDKDKFIELLPPLPRDVATEVYEVLSTSVARSCPRSVWQHKTESLVREYVRSLI